MNGPIGIIKPYGRLNPVSREYCLCLISQVVVDFSLILRAATISAQLLDSESRMGQLT